MIEWAGGHGNDMEPSSWSRCCRTLLSGKAAHKRAAERKERL